ncbi:hypothetical protein, partial [Pseudoalteromonas phenolica]|uniref:hypothetical protein n=1 Tax=Pseudoalteromonas phenolica TaxID=161398 RepID=UPI00126B3B03
NPSLPAYEEKKYKLRKPLEDIPTISEITCPLAPKITLPVVNKVKLLQDWIVNLEFPTNTKTPKTKKITSTTVIDKLP